MALVLQPAPVHNMQPRSWKGDDDMLVDRLIAASRMKQVSTESLVERTLVPYFDSSDVSAGCFQSLGRAAPATKPLAVPCGLKRHANERSNASLAGSPPRKEGKVVQAKHARRAGKAAALPSGSGASASTTSGGRRGSNSGSDTEMTSPLASTRKPRSSGGKKHALAAAGAFKPALSDGSSSQRKRGEPAAIDMRQLAAASAAASSVLRTPGSKGSAPRAPFPMKFAGPAFTNSPTPDCLPIPTSSLLLAEAAESLRSRLTL